MDVIRVQLDSPSVKLGSGLLWVLVAACAGAQTQTAVGRSFQMELEVRSTRTAIHDFIPVFSARIEAVVREILDQETNPQIRQNLLLWQTNAVTSAATAVFNVDPFIGLVDLIVLGFQMDELARSDQATAWFGRHQPAIAESSERILLDMDELLRVLSDVAQDKPQEGALEEIQAWAKAHPVRGLGFARRPVSSEFWDELAQDRYKGLAAVSKLEDLAEDFADRSRVLLALAPKQAQWQGELLMERILELQEVEGLRTDVGRASQAAVDLAAFVDKVDDRLEAAQRELLRQFDLRLDDITRRGQVVFDDAVSEVGGQRDQVMGHLRTLSQQVRAQVVQEVEAQREALLDDFEIRARALVDYATFRAAQLLGVLMFVACAAGAIFALILRRRRQSPPASQRPAAAD